MIHRIKSLYDSGNGLSIRAISRETGVSRNTVRKYLRLDEQQLCDYKDSPERVHQIDRYFPYIKHLLRHYPGLSSVKIQRKLKQKFADFAVSDRTLRRHVAKLREQVCEKQVRYYEPVLDMVPGQQCQVDPGELRKVVIGGKETTVYFVVFVLSYSRLMYVACSLSPIDTSTFIRMHDAAFRYFGGCPGEVVYDQTKLVVIDEQYRELTLNQRMAEYATLVGYSIRACEGYDPESKGKVEAGVKYVKNNALYGETFASFADLQGYLCEWLDKVANVRIHGTTGKQPQAVYEAEERAAMQPYLTPAVVHQDGQGMTRQADKTGLISFKANKYSVPLAYQRQQVGVRQEGNQLIILDRHSHQEIARHPLHQGQGKTIKNTNHYRDPSVKITELEQQVVKQIGKAHGHTLCALLKATSPKIYRDQLSGILSIIKRLGVPDEAQIQSICQRSKLTARQFETLLAHLQQAPVDNSSGQAEEKISSGALKRYQSLTIQGGEHVLH